MSQIKENCTCQDWSLQTANLGIATITTADSDLTGASALTVLTAGGSGTIVKSVTIKAIAPVTVGMVRLFIENAAGSAISLYKEIPIPVTPSLAGTPTPMPILQMFETTLMGGLKLQSGAKLLASTQTTQTFKIIAEGLDCAYPGTVPSTCCNFLEEIPNTGIATVSTANTALDGSGNVATLYTGNSGTKGSTLKSITIKALQGTNEGMIRIFVGTSGHMSLMKEIYIPHTNQGSFEPSFKQVVEMNFKIGINNIVGVTTQNSESFAVTAEGADWKYGIS